MYDKHFQLNLTTFLCMKLAMVRVETVVDGWMVKYYLQFFVLGYST